MEGTGQCGWDGINAILMACLCQVAVCDTTK